MKHQQLDHQWLVHEEIKIRMHVQFTTPECGQVHLLLGSLGLFFLQLIGKEKKKQLNSLGEELKC